jgi:hypothetical protein
MLRYSLLLWLPYRVLTQGRMRWRLQPGEGRKEEICGGRKVEWEDEGWSGGCLRDCWFAFVVALSTMVGHLMIDVRYH